jgi:hypothetical protein
MFNNVKGQLSFLAEHPIPKEKSQKHQELQQDIKEIEPFLYHEKPPNNQNDRILNVLAYNLHLLRNEVKRNRGKFKNLKDS